MTEDFSKKDFWAGLGEALLSPTTALQEVEEQLEEKPKPYRAHDYATPVPPGKTVSELGRIVNDTEQHAQWRQSYYKYAKKQREAFENDIEKMREIIAKRKIGRLNILGTKQVAEQIKCSHATAYNLMRPDENGESIIPSFLIGRRWFTHDYVLDQIMKKGRALVKEGYADKALPRMVWRSEHKLPWR